MTRIFIGPSPEGVTGQSVAFAAAARMAGPDDVVLHYSSWGDTSLRKAARFLSAFGVLLKTLATRQVALVYITTSRTRVGFLRDALMILPARLLRRPRIVNHLHGSDFASFREKSPGWQRSLVDYVYRRIDCSVVLDESMAGEYAAYPGMTIRVVPNFVADETMSLRPPVFSKPPADSVEVLFLANLIPEKGLVETIRAVDALKAGGIAARLSIVGKADGQSALELARATLGLTYEFGDHIEVLGPLYGREKAEALRRADIFVLPTYYESEAFPLTVLEAMAFGCAVVLSTHRYLPAIFGGHSVSFVPPRSWEALRDALAELIADAGKRLDMGGRNWAAAATFTETKFRARLGAILDEFTRRVT